MARGDTESHGTICYKVYTITPPGAYVAQYDIVYGYLVASRTLRRMSTNSFMSTGMIFCNSTSGLAEADGSSRNLAAAHGSAKYR